MAEICGFCGISKYHSNRGLQAEVAGSMLMSAVEMIGEGSSPLLKGVLEQAVFWYGRALFDFEWDGLEDLRQGQQGWALGGGPGQNS
jgi:hypothetical protein